MTVPITAAATFMPGSTAVRLTGCWQQVSCKSSCSIGPVQDPKASPPASQVHGPGALVGLVQPAMQGCRAVCLAAKCPQGGQTLHAAALVQASDSIAELQPLPKPDRPASCPGLTPQQCCLLTYASAMMLQHASPVEPLQRCPAQATPQLSAGAARHARSPGTAPAQPQCLASCQPLKGRRLHQL